MKEGGGRTPRMFVSATLQPEAVVALPRGAAHHATRVLRLRSGAAVVLFDGSGGEFDARLRLEGRDEVLAEIGERRAVSRESPLAVTLAQGISSGEKMDFTIQKAVELGVAAIQPVTSERSRVRLSAEREASRLEHWRRVAIAACEQCGRNRVPGVAAPVPPGRLQPAPGETAILLSPAGADSLRAHARGPLLLAVGPEAGFSEAEERALVRAGFVRARLGPRTLRTETAALAALAALNALAGDF